MESEIYKRLDEQVTANAQLELEVAKLSDRIGQIEADNRELADRCSEAEEAYCRFVNLYVASQRLFTTLDLGEIIEIIKEIVVNLVGSEGFGLYFLSDEVDRRLRLAAEVFFEQQEHRRPAISNHYIQTALRDGSLFVADDIGSSPVAVVPLSMEDEVLGVLVLYDVLPQKSQLTATDMELFELLASSAGRAFYAAGLHATRGSSLGVSTVLCEHLDHAESHR